ncbi:MAG: hypothetical protein MJ081_07115 [Ruminococcus sp.]|nr:hypothetical protein [Ruminococcus sp.]
MKANRILSIALSAGMLLSAVSCGQKKEEPKNNLVSSSPAEDISVNEENMPYGATVVRLRPSSDEDLKIDVEFDRRYFNSYDEGEKKKYPEIYLISDYIYAISNKDVDLMEKIFYKDYLLYNIKGNGYETTQDYLEQYRQSLKDAIGAEFDLDYIIVDTCVNENESDNVTGFSVIDDQLNEIAGEKISDRVTSRKAVYLDVFFTDENKNFRQLNNLIGYDISLYIYEIDGQYYLL